MHEPIPEQSELAGKQLLDAAYRVHTLLGPGLIESVYEKCLCHELRKRRIQFASQVSLPINYDGESIDASLRIDILVEYSVIVELKAVETLLPIHQAQLITYLKLTGFRLGFLINFNHTRLRDGIKRIVV